MSETETGWIELEDGDGQPVAADPEPAPTPEPAPEPVQAATEQPVTPPAEEEDEPRDALTSNDGKTYVPISALREARENIKALKQQLAQPRTLSPEEQRQVDSAQYLAVELQNRPDIIDALQTGRRLTREQERTVERVEATNPASSPMPVAEFDDAELRKIAELQGYYHIDGSEDLGKAKEYLGILDLRAAKLADARVAPLIQRSLASDSDRQIEQVAAMAVEMGVSADEVRPILRELAKADPKLMAESPEYGLMAVIVAAGMKAIQQAKHPTPAASPAASPASPAAPAARPEPTKEPLLVERSVGPARTPPVSVAERARAKHYGIDPKAFERAGERIQKAEGGIISFEED